MVKYVTAVTAYKRAVRDIAPYRPGWSRPSFKGVGIMNVQETSEIRELTVDEMDQVSGAWLKTAVGIVVGFLLTPGKQTIPEFLAHLD